jgi:Icc-related predicted phosphoesterase
VRILFTADLHLLRATRDQTLERLDFWIDQNKPEVLVVAGDLASASNAGEVFDGLRNSFPTGPIAVCLGNHDFWLHDSVRSEFGSLEDVVAHYWEPAAERYEITLLDVGSCRLGELTLIGAYGHYDLGFRVPDLQYEGVRVTEEHYLSGQPPFDSGLRWRDFQLMPAGLNLAEVAADQVKRIRLRLLASREPPMIAVLHTPPYEELLGIPSLTGFDPERISSPYAFFRAYLGNRAMGELLDGFRDRLLGIVCGHTHRMAGPVDLNGVIGVNIGSDYGYAKAVIYDSGRDLWRRL